MKCLLEFVFASRTHFASADIDWPLPVIPRVGEVIWGLGIDETPALGALVQRISYFADGFDVRIHTGPIDGVDDQGFGDSEYREIYKHLESSMWRIQQSEREG